ncbi:MAG TPA: DNA gyrase subunit A, partial [Methanocorpusculum sp.]|nr:DNA gyrase subunit A [Methanocorpusculum sp.]
IADLVKAKQIEGISDLRDESDKDGIRVIVELKQGVQGNVILNQLYKHTPLESSFGITNLAIVEKKPMVLSLAEILRYFISHRMSVVRRRSQFDLQRAEEHKHILDGLIKALELIDEVITTIRDSPEIIAAQVSLIDKFGFSERQADAILKMQLRRLAALEQQKIITELNELQIVINNLNWILSSDSNILSIVKDEIIDIHEKYADKRRTKIDYSVNANLDVLDFIEDKQVLVMLTSQNYIKRMPLESCRQQRRGGRGVMGMTTKDEDSVNKVFLASTHDYLLCFTNQGRVYWLRVHEIPEGSRQSKGKAIVNLLSLTNEDITAVIPLRRFESNKYLFFATKMGKVGKLSEELFSHPRSGGLIAMTILEGDELVDVMVTDGSCDIVLTTWLGQSLRFSESEVRSTGRGVQGVKGITLRRGDVVRALTLVEKDHLLTITEGGYGKRTSFDEFHEKGRGTMGVRNILTNLERGGVVSSLAIGNDEEIVITTAGGVVMRTQADDISIQKRSTQGVRVIRVDEGDRVTSIAVVPAGEEEISSTSLII